MAKTVTQGRRPDAPAGTDAIYRSLFDSFNPDSGGRISPLEVLTRTLEFYFQGCSIEVDAQMLAVAAASLANAGVCPLTDAGRPYQPTVLAGPLEAIIAVRQVIPAVRRIADLDRAAHDGQRADQGARLRVRAGRL